MFSFVELFRGPLDQETTILQSSTQYHYFLLLQRENYTIFIAIFRLYHIVKIYDCDTLIIKISQPYLFNEPITKRTNSSNSLLCFLLVLLISLVPLIFVQVNQYYLFQSYSTFQRFSFQVLFV